MIRAAVTRFRSRSSCERARGLTLARVYVEEPIVYRGVSAQYEASQRQDDLERLRQASEQTGVRAQLRWCRASSVGRGLHELCGPIGADLLVVGASRRRAPARALLGDDTRGALDGSPCAVAIAPVGYGQRLRQYSDAVDLLVIGPHGEHQTRRLHGRTLRELTRTGQRPVLILPPKVA